MALHRSRFNQGDGLEPFVEVDRVNGDRQGRLRIGDEHPGSSVCVEVDNGHGEWAYVWLTPTEALAVADAIRQALGE